MGSRRRRVNRFINASKRVYCNFFLLQTEKKGRSAAEKESAKPRSVVWGTRWQLKSAGFRLPKSPSLRIRVLPVAETRILAISATSSEKSGPPEMAEDHFPRALTALNASPAV